MNIWNTKKALHFRTFNKIQCEKIMYAYFSVRYLTEGAKSLCLTGIIQYHITRTILQKPHARY